MITYGGNRSTQKGQKFNIMLCVLIKADTLFDLHVQSRVKKIRISYCR